MSHTNIHPTHHTATLASKSLPARRTPVWERNETTIIHDRADLRKVITGRLRIGLLPEELITEEERLEIVSRLRYCSNKQFNNFDAIEKAFVHGTPFVDADTLLGYLTGDRDEVFDEITAPLLQRLIGVLQSCEVARAAASIARRSR